MYLKNRIFVFEDELIPIDNSDARNNEEDPSHKLIPCAKRIIRKIADEAKVLCDRLHGS
jgi:hypothetical protein